MSNTKSFNQILPETWTVTFTDLLILLLAFFVLRFTLYSNQPAMLKSKFPKSEITAVKPLHLIYQQLHEFLIQTTRHREITTHSDAGKLSTLTLFNEQAILIPADNGATLLIGINQPELIAEELPMRLIELLNSVSRFIDPKIDHVFIRHMPGNITSNNSSLGSVWSQSSAISATIYRQLIDSGIDKAKVSVESIFSKNPLNKDFLILEFVANTTSASKNYNFESILLNPQRQDSASESKMIFLDLWSSEKIIAQ